MIPLAYCALSLLASASAQELQLSACDSASPYSAGGGAAVSINAADKKEGNAAFQITRAQTPANGPYVRIDAPAPWASYSGIRFWVKRTSGAEEGAALQLL